MSIKKRLFDLVVASLLLLLCSPLILILSLVSLVAIGSPIIFSQLRPGKGGVPFKMYKFRTMLDKNDEYGIPLPDSQRIFRYGQFLRSSSLDELPGLWNVVKGDMSLVGPRPLLVEYLPLYNDFQLRRHEVRPGITGWAQVNGRNTISWENKFKYDIWYVENQSFLLDVKIIWLTMKKVIAREGISADGEVTMPKFTGNKE